MKQTLHILTILLVLGLGAQGAHAACYAEYKAKRDNPLELYYDVAVVNEPCNKASARAQLQAQLASQGLIASSYARWSVPSEGTMRTANRTRLASYSVSCAMSLTRRRKGNGKRRGPAR